MLECFLKKCVSMQGIGLIWLRIGTVREVLTGKLTGKRPLGRPSIARRTMLEWILKKYVSMQGIGLIWLRIRIIREPS